MVKKKKANKKEYKPGVIDVSPERSGRIRGRVFTSIDKRGRLEAIEVDHVKESPPGKGEAYLSMKDRGPLRLHRTRKDVARAYPHISPKLPKLR